MEGTVSHTFLKEFMEKLRTARKLKDDITKQIVQLKIRFIDG